jgi:hypothetical protein
MLKKSLFSPARPRLPRRAFSHAAFSIPVKREAYLANMPQPVLKRETNDTSRTKRAAFLSILRGCFPLVPDVQAIEVLLCRNGFSAAP